MSAIRVVLTIVAVLLADTAFAQASGKALPPLRITSKAEPVTFMEGGAQRTYYRILPGKPIELGTIGEMTLLVPVRALGDGMPGAMMNSVTVEVIAQGVAPVKVTEVLSNAGPTVQLSNGFLGMAPKVIRVPINVPAATVRISVDLAPGAAVGFARQPAATIAQATPTPAATPLAAVTPKPSTTPRATPLPTAVAAATPIPPPVVGTDPALDPMSLAVVPLPLIRRRPERLGLGPRVAYVVPTGAVDTGGDATSNLFAGAELRFTPLMLDRRVGVTLESGAYKLQDTEPLNATTPFGVATSGDVKVTMQVVPVLGGLVYRQRLGSGDKQAVFAGANGGVVLATRTEETEFRDARRSSETRVGAQGRMGYERRIGPGRTVLEASYLHVTESEDELNDTYIGGAFLGLQYRFVF